MSEEFVCDGCQELVTEEFGDPLPGGRRTFCFDCHNRAYYQMHWDNGLAWFAQHLPTMDAFVAAYCKRHKFALNVRCLAGNCHPASKLLYDILKTTPGCEPKIKRGHWLGPNDSHRLFTQHSWNSARLEHNDIEFYLDATQWVFTGKPPAIAICESDDDRYDEAGLRVAQFLHGDRRLPERETEQLETTRLSKEAQAAITHVFEARDWSAWTMAEMFEIANVNPDRFYGNAAEIFKAIAKAGHKGFIPRESYELVFNGGHHP